MEKEKGKTNAEAAEVQRRIDDLQAQLAAATKELDEIQTHNGNKSSVPSENNGPKVVENSNINREESEKADAPLLPPPAKRGYLMKWQDRSLGWGMSRWDKRFVCLERGRLSYYRSHEDPAPRYVLQLRRCAVRDDGCKLNKRHSITSSNITEGGKPPALDEAGAYFHVFSIYQRLQRTAGKTLDRYSSAAEDDDEDDIVPLLRFSTTSLAEKNQWIMLITEACAYCDSEAFLQEDSAEPSHRSTLNSKNIYGSESTTKQTRGTLPPLFFETPSSSIPRAPSGNFSLKRSQSGQSMKYLKVSRKKDAAKSEPLSTAAYPPSKPMHRAAGPSYLSDEAPIQNYRGLLNLMVLVLVVANARLTLDNVRNHGFFLSNVKIDMVDFSHDPLADSPFYSGFALLQLFIFNTYSIEKLLSRRTIGETTGLILHMVNANAALFVPMVIVWFFMEGRPLPGGFLLLQASITWMKLLSYLHANADYRTSGKRDPQQSTLALIQDHDKFDATKMSYPSNVTLSNIYYFWLAPTLTYQITFPRSPRVRPMKVATLVIRLIVTTVFLLFLMGQVIGPNLDRLTQDMAENEGIFTPHIAAEYLLNLSLASTYAWLLFFYIFFHLFLNLLAEILRFGDRVFYRDWWNASEVSAYWRLWNMPVHYWLVRHVYFPCIRLRMSKTMAGFVVFFVSAVMHEVLVSVPFHMVKHWSFLGMMGQIPLVAITKYFDKKMPGSSIGNVIFWVSFCIVGQPMAILLYTVDYWNLKNSNACEAGMKGGVCTA